MSESGPVPIASNTFERIKHVNAAGADFWSARELARVLEYADFRNFITVIAKAREAARTAATRSPNHFVDINEIVSTVQERSAKWKIGRSPATPVI